MRQALAEAQKSIRTGDVPVGCVITRGERVVATGRNRREKEHDATAHAEIVAIRAACRALDTWRLSDCTLYVTLEPCPMCAGAIINARIGTVVFGAYDAKAGACGSVLDLFSEAFNHRPRVYAGVLAAECGDLLKLFFEGIR